MEDYDYMEEIERIQANYEFEIENFQDEIKQLQTELEKHCWILVSERLPKKEQYILLLSMANANFEVLAFKYTTRNQTYIEKNFTHWKPIILP